MLDFIVRLIYYPLFEIVEFFVWLYQADDRPVAQRFTLGCAAIVGIMVIVGLLIACS
jgi:hypothetical protein